VRIQHKLIKSAFTGQLLGKLKPKNFPNLSPWLTSRSQFFHADDSDIVGLLCIARALEGGESDIVSSHHVWNTLQKERPDVAETLTKPIWYFDRKGETSVDEEPYIRTSVFYLEKGINGRVYSKWDPYYIKSLDRFMNAGVIPHLSPERMCIPNPVSQYECRGCGHQESLYSKSLWTISISLPKQTSFKFGHIRGSQLSNTDSMNYRGRSY